MIGYLKGVVVDSRVDRVIVEVSGLGYVVHRVGFEAKTGDSVTLYIHDRIREDAHDLYGFADRDTLDLFETIIGVNGVGPKLAAKILSLSTPTEVARRILQGDVEYLTSIPGVGKKTAQKIVLELKGVLVTDEGQASDNDALSALMSLGYARSEASEALAGVEASSTDERIKLALRSLGR